jgi:glycosyltransferase involved in cell wall biosynthesis
MRGYEPWVLKHYDRTIVSSPADKSALLPDNDMVEVIPNGVDLDYFTYYTGPRDAATIVFLGKMSYYVNVASILWFYNQVFPLVRKQHPDVKLKIVGRNPTSTILSLRNDPAVEVTGTVEDVRPFLSKATLSVCPMVSGAGIQNKMLEAMAMGTPCVATNLACQALQTQVGQDVVVADSAEDLATAIGEMLNDPECRYQLGVQGRRYVENFHDWTKIGLRLNSLYDNLVSNNQ